MAAHRAVGFRAVRRLTFGGAVLQPFLNLASQISRSAAGELDPFWKSALRVPISTASSCVPRSAAQDLANVKFHPKVLHETWSNRPPRCALSHDAIKRLPKKRTGNGREFPGIFSLVFFRRRLPRTDADVLANIADLLICDGYGAEFVAFRKLAHDRF